MPKGITPLLFFLFLIVLLARSSQHILRIFQESSSIPEIIPPTNLCQIQPNQLASNDRYRANYFLLTTNCNAD